MAPFRPFRHNKRQQIALRPSRRIFFHYAIFFFRESLWSNGVGAHLEAQESRQPFSWDIQMGENYNSIVMFEFDWIVLEDGYAEKGLIRWNIKIHEWIVDLDRVGDWIEPPYVDISFNDPSFFFFFFYPLEGKSSFRYGENLCRCSNICANRSVIWVSLCVIKEGIWFQGYI